MNDALSNGFYFESHTIAIRQPNESDVLSGKWSSWYNSYSVTKYNSHGVFPVTIDDELRYVNERIARKDSLLFSVIDKESNKLIGNASLQNIDLINRRANIAITIGNPSGISTAVQVYGLILDHAFCRLNLNRVGDATHENLGPLVKMLSVIGFSQEGRFRDYFYRDGGRSDAICFSVLQHEFLKLKESRSGNILFDSLDHLESAVVKAVKSVILY
jgi:RimJ/RimL family protein N-acetyltransferase